MQLEVWLVEAIILVIVAIGVGTLASMLGIGGGVINTPMLIIVFGIPALLAPASALLAALFVAVASTIIYHRQKPRPIVNKAGLFLAITTIPGSWVGVWLRTLITDDYLLRLIFGILLFPVALKMLFAKKKGKGDFASEIESFDMSQVPRQRLILALVGGFGGGAMSGLLGLGGGVVVVPVLTILIGLPIHAAVATSMFTMIFTTTSGSIMNYFVLLAEGEVERIMLYGIILGIGMIVGAQIGPRIACRINAVQLKRIFGLVLVFPLIKMMKLGQIWLDPFDQSLMLATFGDIIIWLVIVVPIGLLRFYLTKKESNTEITDAECEVPD